MNKIRLFLGRTKRVGINFIKRKLFYPYIVPLYHKYLVWKLRRKEKVNVVFFATNRAMWCYQGLYELMAAHPKFNPTIVLSFFANYAKEQQEQDLEALRRFFRSKNIPFIEPYDAYGNLFDAKKELNPDIAFFQQLYNGISPTPHDSTNYHDRLICYHPYAFWLGKEDWGFNLDAHKIAWKLFYATDIHKKVAHELCDNKGRNVSIVGYSNADVFRGQIHVDKWKQQHQKKKRIIWAPHFTIDAKRCFTAHSEFLWMADFMLNMAKEYANEIQFAFKPHPRLLTELYHHKDWGKEKADAYYKLWNTMENTQLETGDFIDLFMGSDAMIHDSGSFCAEYHYTQKPVMFVSKNVNHFRDTFNDFGKQAIDLHYFAETPQQVRNFVESVVLKGEDTRLHERTEFYSKYLLPPGNRTVAENMFNEIYNSIYP